MQLLIAAVTFRSRWVHQFLPYAGRDGKHTYHAIEFNLATLLGEEVSGSGSGGSELDVLLVPAFSAGSEL